MNKKFIYTLNTIYPHNSLYFIGKIKLSNLKCISIMKLNNIKNSNVLCFAKLKNNFVFLFQKDNEVIIKIYPYSKKINKLLGLCVRIYF